MTRKADFNAEEWSLVLEGPLMAGMLVIAADRGGTLRETVSLARAYAEARQQHGSGELLDEIVASNPQIDPVRVRSPEELRTTGLQRVREAVDLVRRKATPEEVGDYTRFIETLADKVAHAHREGGVLGIGGKEVSDSERAALDDIAAALR